MVDVSWTGSVGSFAVRGCAMTAQVRYTYDSTVNLDLYGLARGRMTGPAGSAAVWDGELVLRQGPPLRAGERSQRWLLPKPLDLDVGGASDVQRAISDYGSRGATVMLADPTETWVPGSTGDFECRMRLRVPVQRYTYKRARLDVVLLGWVKVLAVWYVVRWIVDDVVSATLFRFRSFPTRVTSDLGDGKAW